MTIGRIHGLPFGVFGMGRPNHRRDALDLGPSAFTILFKMIQRSLRNRRERMALASLSDFSEPYQAAVDRPAPVWRRLNRKPITS